MTGGVAFRPSDGEFRASVKGTQDMFQGRLALVVDLAFRGQVRANQVWGRRDLPRLRDLPDLPTFGWNGAALAARGDKPLCFFNTPLVSGMAGVKEGESTFKRFLALRAECMSACNVQGHRNATDLSDWPECDTFRVVL